ncbi:MAG: hypothetical protein CSA95_03360 [Bacteroidetes bacterium]|nr:MAG: hypothetical protein CSA95_03360 [Bacteroidota bacterium]PIE88375.1 MAG: hypothetical protein CSA04_02240 [Bacteroidota bacterium]
MKQPIKFSFTGCFLKIINPETMKKILFGLLCVLMSVGLLAQQAQKTTYTQQTSSKASITFTVEEYHLTPISLSGKDYTSIHFEKGVTTRKKGYAELPFLSTNIQIANNKNVDVKIVDTQYTDIVLDAPLKPSRGVIYRSQNRDEIPYTIDPASIKDEWYPNALVEQKEPFIIRDIRGTSIFVYPFQYNAVTQTLRVYSSVTVEITENDETPTNPLTSSRTKYFHEMNGIYQSLFINYNMERQDLTINEAGDILVITTSRDEQAIQPYVEWKKEKGYNVHVEVVATGTNVVNLIQEKYNENPDILYVQLVGDWPDIKVDAIGNAPMDPMAGCVVGTDVFPDICVGRFSASNPQEVSNQVNKTIQYEKNPQEGGQWYETAMGIASAEGAGKGDDNEVDKDHVQIIYDNRLDPFTYNGYFPNYDPGANPNEVANGINSGVSLINYCGHGSSTSWGTSGFNNGNIANLTNENRLPAIISVACLNGTYQNGEECFAEAWLRKPDGGAIATLMATIPQPWQPPMRGQDYMNDVLIGGYDYDNNPGSGINNNEQRTTFGSITANGMVLMYSESQGSEDLETIQTWVLFGDASVQIRTAPPAPITVSNNVILLGSSYATTVTSDGVPVANALVSISQEEHVYSGYTNENGEVTIENELEAGDVKLVVTAFNTQTIYETISCIPPEGPYVIYESSVLNDENGNGTLEYGESATMDLSMKNVGIEAANNVVVTLTSENEYVTITDEQATFETIPEGGSQTEEEAFSFEVAAHIPDGEKIHFDLLSTDGTDTWPSKFSITAYAPTIQVNGMAIDDASGNGNGRLDAGETVNLMVSVTNIGHAISQDIMAELSSSSPYISFDNTTATHGPIEMEESTTLTFTVHVDASTPIGTLANFVFNGSTGEYPFEKTFASTIGITVEDFETGDFSSFPWYFEGSGNWTITEGEVYEGSFSAQSANIGDNQNTSMAIDYEVIRDDTISFYYKISTEANYDIVRFYIDNNVIAEWSGEKEWTQFKAPVSQGAHTFKWDYSKDYMATAGSDCLWLDFIILPPEMRTIAYAGEDDYACDNEPYTLQPEVANYATLQWSTSGTGTFDDATQENASYTPSQEDLENGSVIITLEVTGNDTQQYTDEMTLSFGRTPTIEAGEDGHICEEESFELLATGTDYESVKWTSSGDGTFTNATALETTYVPGENDINNGSVTLSLMAFSGCGNVNDFTTLYLHDGPEMPAPVEGNSEVCANSQEQYTSEGSPNASSYRWSIKPSEAGTVEADNLTASVSWNAAFSGEAVLRIIATNDCGDTQSEMLFINVKALTLAPAAPMGADSVDTYVESSSPFTIQEIAGVTEYNFTLTPSEAGEVSWESTTATVQWNTAFKGTALLSACGINECGEGHYSESKQVIVYSSVGINERETANWEIYPNPAQNRLYVETANIEEATAILLYNTTGTKVMNVNVVKGVTTTLDISTLSNGIYFISIQTEGGNSAMKKVIINR